MQAPIFWQVFAAVLSAILLSGVFFWSLISYTRIEREGKSKSEGGLQLGWMLMTVFFLIASLWIVFPDKSKFGVIGKIDAYFSR